MKMITMFNHKGGVSKTTTTYNLGWKLASAGHKTLIVDADPQCNLTAMVLNVEDIAEFYEKNPKCDIFSCISPVLNGNLSSLESGSPYQTINKNLFLFCGNLDLSDAETQMSVAITTSTAIPAIKNLPGSIGELIRKTAIENEFEYVILDLSPSIGALNQCLFMASDYFIIPTSPDFFCAQAIKSLSNIIPKWNEDINKFRDDSITYRFPNQPPKFIGFISQRFRPRGGLPAKSFQRWIDVIRDLVNTSLIPSLNKINMSIPIDVFKTYIKGDEPFNLVNIADFNSLIAQSQKYCIPIYALSDDQIEQSGVILDTMKKSRDSFDNTFTDFAQQLHNLVQNV